MSDEQDKIQKSLQVPLLIDIAVIGVLAVLAYITALSFSFSGIIVTSLASSSGQQAAALILVAIFLSAALVAFAIRRWMELMRIADDMEAVEGSLHRTQAKLMFINNITRYDMLNELTQLHKDLEQGEKSLTVTRVDDAINRIRRQIKFTKEYQDIGAVPPLWQNAADAIMRAKVGVDLGNVGFQMDIHDVEVYADPLLEKVFYYLISNSLKYGGSSLTKIRIYRKKADDHMVIIFEDDGGGISQEMKGYLFPKEWGSRKHTGYGLFLIRETLAVTGITIHETGAQGAGARFEISVPKGVFRQT